MTLGGSRSAALLFLGDLAVFVAALWLTLLVRYRTLPSADSWLDHLGPFAFLFALWFLVFYISGLYGKGVILLKSRWPDAIMRTQVVNVVLAALFFFLAPGIAIAPKTNLVIYLVISLLLIFLWRLAVYPRLATRSVRYPAALIASGEDAELLAQEVNGSPRYRLTFPVVLNPRTVTESELVQALTDSKIEIVVVDTDAPDLEPVLSRLSDFSHLEIVSFIDIYEEVFDRVPLASVPHGRFLERLAKASFFYRVAKRLIDVVGGILMGVITIIAIPFIFFAQRLEGPGPLFIVQDRMGERGKRIRAYKFRSMQHSDAGAWAGENQENRVTKIGALLRRTSLDEFPQFLNVLSGELSLIGPRSDIEALGKRLADAIPYYHTRYLVTPGITGWAQISQQYEPGNISPQSIEETKVRLAYDFYYLKKRSLALDLVIALKTMNRMFFRVGSW